MSEDLAVGYVDQSNGKSSFEIDFGALRDKAAEMMDAASSPAADAAPAETPKEPAEADPSQVRVKGASDGQAPEAPKTEEVAEVTEDTSAKQLAALKDDDLVSVIVDGEEQVMPWKEARAGISRTSKFTKNMQQLAKEKAEFEPQKARLTQLESERAGLENFLNNKEAVLRYVRQTFGEDAVPAPQAVPQSANPDEIVTYSEAQAIAAAQGKTLEQQIQTVVTNVEKRINEATREIEAQREIAAHSIAINSTLTEIFAANPVLKSIPRAEELIRYEVAQMKPQTEAEALDAFRTVAQGMTEEIGKHFKAQQKIQVVAAAKQKLESKSIEPAGGSAPQIAPTNFKNPDGSVNWKAVTKMAQDAL